MDGVGPQSTRRLPPDSGLLCGSRGPSRPRRANQGDAFVCRGFHRLGRLRHQRVQLGLSGLGPCLPLGDLNRMPLGVDLRGNQGIAARPGNQGPMRATLVVAFLKRGQRFASRQLANTIIAQNTAGISSPDISGTFQNLSFNLIGDATGSNTNTTSPLIGTATNPVDARLDILRDHGGATLTHALLPDSPAIDAVGATNRDRPTRRTTNSISRRCRGL